MGIQVVGVVLDITCAGMGGIETQRHVIKVPLSTRNEGDFPGTVVSLVSVSIPPGCIINVVSWLSVVFRN